MDEFEKMSLGKIYDPQDEKLVKLKVKAHNLCREFNTLDERNPRRDEILKELLGSLGENTFLQGPIFFDYGCLTTIGKNSYANFNFMIVDCCTVQIGDNVFIGPNVSLLPPMHPLIAEERNLYAREDGIMTDKEYAKPITICDDCWIAGNVTICGGVTIGKGCVIGAGSVVTKDIPEGYLAFGNPCKPIREITPEDSIYLKKELF